MTQLPPGAVPYGSGYWLNGQFFPGKSSPAATPAKAADLTRPSFASRIEERQRRGEGDAGPGREAIAGAVGLANRAAKATGLDYVYKQAVKPSRAAGSAIRDTVPGVPGRVLGTGAEFALDPLTLIGLLLAVPSAGSSLTPTAARAGLMGTARAAAGSTGGRLALNLAGRGELSIPRYLATTAAAGAGTQVAEELGAGTVGQVGGGLLGGTAALSNAPRAWRRQYARTVAAAQERTAQRVERFAPAAAAKLRTAAEANRPLNVITRGELERMINSHEGRIIAVRENPNRNPIEAANVLSQEYRDNIDALRSLSKYMGDTGRSEIPLTTDAYDLGRRTALHYKAQSAYDEWSVMASQAGQYLDHFKTAASELPDYRSRDIGKPETLSAILRREMLDIAPDLAPAQENFATNKSQVLAIQNAVTEADSQLKVAKKAEREAMKAAIGQAPTGSRATVKDYISALIGGNEQRIAQLSTRLSRRWPEFSSADFDTPLAAHKATAETESLVADLRSQLDEATTSFKSVRETQGKQVEQGYTNVVRKLRSTMFRPENGSGFYRLGRLAVQEDGTVVATLDKVKAAKTPREAIESGAAEAAEQSRAIREAEQKFADLRLAAEEARTVGKMDEWRQLRSQAQEARKAIDTLKRPARPVPLSTLPQSPNRITLPLNDMSTRFQPMKLTEGTRSVIGTTIRDTRTVALLNTKTRLELEVDQIGRELTAIESGMDEMVNQLGYSSLTDLAPEQIATLAPEVRTQAARFLGQKERLSDQLMVKQGQLEDIDSRIIQGQQNIDAAIADAQSQFDKAVELRDSAYADLQSADASLAEAFTVNNADSIAAQSVNRMRAFSQHIHDVAMSKADSRLMSQGALNDLMADLRSYNNVIRSNLPKNFKEKHASLSRRIEEWIPRVNARAHVAAMLTPHQFSEQNLDPFAVRRGAAGWLNRAVLARGQKTAAGEGIANTYLNGRNMASFLAGADYGGGYLNARKVAGTVLSDIAKEPGERGAWAQNLLRQNEDAQLSALVSETAKPVTDSSWQKLLKSLTGDHQLNAQQQELLHGLLSDNFAVAAIFPDLFKTRAMSPALRRITEEWGNAFRDLQKLTEVETGSSGSSIVNKLLKPEYRESYGAQGRIPARIGSTSAELVLKRDQRNIITDLAEVIRRMEADPKAPPLHSIVLGAAEMAETLPAQLLMKFNDNETYRSLSKYLKNPDDWKLLARGQELPTTAWNDTDIAADWSRIQSTIKQIEGGGQWGLLNQASNGVSRLVASTLVGDLGWTTIQLGSALLSNPVAAVRTIGRAITAGTTDQGFAAYLSEPQNYELLRHAVERGLGIGMESITGAPSGGTIWDLMPLTRPIGRAMNTMNKLTFDRAQTILKVEALKANLGTLQALKEIGREKGQQFVDGIPALEAVHKQADLWNSTNEEVFDAVIRTVNNQLGGLPRSQRANEAWREWAERMLLMVPGFFRARAGLLNQATRILGDPTAATAQGVEGWLAASILSREIGMAALISGAAAAALGKETDWWENVKGGPGTGTKWLSIPLGEGSYLPIMPTTGAMSLYSRLATGSSNLADANLDPRSRTEAVTRFFEGRQNPVVATLTEQLRGRDFFGRRLDSWEARAAHAMQTVLPMWVGETISEGYEASRRGDLDPVSLATQTGAEFLGRNYRPPLPAEQLSNAFKAWQMEALPGQPPVEWQDAPGDLRRAAREGSEEVARLEQSFLHDLDRRASDLDLQRNFEWKGYQDDVAKLDELQAAYTAEVVAGRMSLEDWRKHYVTINEDRADASSTLSTRLAKLGIDLSEGEADNRKALLGGEVTNDVALALLNYRAIRPTDPQFLKQRPITGRLESGIIPEEDIDWQAFGRAREEALAQFSPQVQQQVRTLLEPDDPIAQRLLSARTAMDQYWTDIPKYRGIKPDESRYVDAVLGQLRNIEEVARSRGISTDYRQIWRAGLAHLAKAGFIENRRQAELAAYAFQYGTANATKKLQLRDPASIMWLLENPDIMRFYSWMTRELPNKVIRLLPQDIQPQLQLAAVADSQLRGVSPGSIGQ